MRQDCLRESKEQRLLPVRPLLGTERMVERASRKGGEFVMPELSGADILVRGFLLSGRVVGPVLSTVVVADTPRELWNKIADLAATFHQSRGEAVRIVIDVAVDEGTRKS